MEIACSSLNCVISFVGQPQQNVFDRRAKFIQKERAAANPLVADYDFLKEEIGYRHVFLSNVQILFLTTHF